MWLLRRTGRERRPLPELLAEWGLPPEDDAAICEGTVSGATGFIVVTPTRFAFVPTGVQRGAARAVEQHALAELVAVEAGRRELVIRWRDGRTTVTSDRRQIARLAALLRPLPSK
jgi:hypothetical protein